MKISMINGSQKTGESNSGIILNRLIELLKEKHEVKLYKVGSKSFTNEMLTEIISGDVIVLAFSLFVDSLPSHTLEMLIELESFIKRERQTGVFAHNLIVYSIVNCGFYEGKQNRIALEILQHWCGHSGVQFGGGIGQGAGEMLGATKDIPMDKGPFNNLARALQAMAEKIKLREPFETVYLSPYFPRFLWRFTGERYWNSAARKNGLRKKDMSKGII